MVSNTFESPLELPPMACQDNRFAVVPWVVIGGAPLPVRQPQLTAFSGAIQTAATGTVVLQVLRGGCRGSACSINADCGTDAGGRDSLVLENGEFLCVSNLR
jgi:hypothetical protein